MKIHSVNSTNFLLQVISLVAALLFPASGNVTAIDNDPRASSIFLTQELPTLLQNPNVTQVTVRSVSGSEVSILRGTSITDALNMIEGF